MEWMATADGWLAFATLTALEIVLGIDNIIFISILSSRLPENQRERGRTLGLALALVTRLLLLLSLAFIMRLEADLFEVFSQGISGRDLIMLAGGLFLLFKATREIHSEMEGLSHKAAFTPGTVTFGQVLLQISLLDIVFSLDSVITAVGMAEHLSIMVAAVVVAVAVMLLAAGPIAKFVEANPTIKMLALSFLVLIGVTLIADGLAFHIPTGYIYFAIAFSVGVEVLNLRASKKRPASRDPDHQAA